MTKVIAGATTSVDGFIAGPEETGFEHLFAWYTAGDVEYQSTHPEVPFHLTPADHAYFSEFLHRVGVFVVGRRLFDLTDGWGGSHPCNKPIVVLTHHIPHEWIDTHRGAPFTFVTGGIKAAIDTAATIAGDHWVGVNGGEMARQALEAGLLHELWVDIAPVLLGGGVPLIGRTDGPVLLEDPEIFPGTRVTHLRYRIL
ncbi:dihydrofolate reductase family protein [Nocardia sp. NPDC088792]|uniref:dihydrofolate reductase family protein n=1 Tax=Nocardia sp. NPDC088792 TaxID=3364332 RepID=UPI00382446DF